MDNKIFNVNGDNDEMLLATLKLVFQQGFGNTAKAWSVSQRYGLILHWWNESKDVNKFPSPLNAEKCFPMVSEWLKSEDAKTVETKGQDGWIDMDGDCEKKGWRIFIPEYNWSPDDREYEKFANGICAIKPAYMWYGK